MEKKQVKVMHGVRLNAEEEITLAKEAEKRGITKSAYIRLCLKNTPGADPAMITAINQLKNEINYIGRNINQIVMDTHSGYFKESEKRELSAYMSKILRKLSEVVTVFGNH